ncbi:hypothetical protein HFO24_16985 [Rhizobium laguerreae]|uniref:hypothetical protein n=1 Tax=Rhizobium laguerreae TaxID=1076926 RepID=UPI001C921CA8|nr:hypothetical protein [Rhizobium laguerreae]MBY3183349.1 hypothetical protein [Rhizobium laguerreae]
MQLKIAFFLALSVCLSSCETTAPTAENLAKVAQIPPNYKDQTVAYFKRTLKDPYSIRDAQITDPTVIFVGLVNGTSAPGVCVQMNGKNSFGAYTGIQFYAVAFKNGALFGVAPPVFDTCTKAVWRPLPELNGNG